MQVRDVMTTDIRAVSPDATIEDVIAIMTTQRVSGVPVVDAKGLLVGILTEGDLLRRAETGTGDHLRPLFLDLLIGSSREAADYIRTHSRRVGDLMTAHVLTVTETDQLRDVVRLMERRRIRRVPVVREGRLVGIVSRFDLIAALGRALSVSAASPATDAEVTAEVEHALQTGPWLARSSIGVRVEHGVATLEGIIHDASMRDPIRVAVQNVRGVTEIRDRIVFVEPSTGTIVPA